MVLSRVSFSAFSASCLTFANADIELFLFRCMQIWDLSDPTGRGFLDKPGMFVALKLVALAQAGNNINMSNIFVECQNPPKVVSCCTVFREFSISIVE